MAIPTNIGRGLRLALTVPAAVVAACVLIVVSDVLPPRSPVITHMLVVLFIAGTVELFAVAAATHRLWRYADTRSTVNILCTLAGGGVLLLWLSVYLAALYY